MQNTSHQWYLNTRPIMLIIKSNWLLLPAICALFGYELLESSVLAKNHDNALTLFGFILPILTLMSALAIAIAIRSNMVLVQKSSEKSKYIPLLLMFGILSGLIFSCLLFLSKPPLDHLLGFNQWLQGMPQTQSAFFAYEQAIFINYKIAGLIPLILIWQINSILRAIGYCKGAACYLLVWMLSKSWVLMNIIDVTAQDLIATLGMMHFYIDCGFALIGLVYLLTKERLSFANFELKSLFENHRATIMVFIGQIIPPCSLFLLIAIAGRFDEHYVGAFAIIFRLEPLILMLPMMFTASMPAVIGVNYWAGARTRSYQLIKLTFIITALFQTLLAVVLYINQGLLIDGLCPDCKQVQIIETYLTILPFSYAALGVALLYPSMINALGQVKHSVQIIFYHRVVIMPLFALFGLLSGNYHHFFIALACAHFGVAGYVVYQLKKRTHLMQPQVTHQPQHPHVYQSP